VDDASGTIELKIGNTYDGSLARGLVEGGQIGLQTLPAGDRYSEAGRRLSHGPDRASDGTIRRGSEIHVELMEFQVHLKVEFEIEDDGTELEIELTW
jgi:hypothetical protein